MRETDEKHLRHALRLAHAAREKGNNPFGAVLVSASGEVLGEGQNNARTTGDPTGHAEINVIREVCPSLPLEERAGAVLYASGEPCPMCAAALFWSGVGRLVFGASSRKAYALLGDPPEQLRLSSREVLWSGRRKVEVEGPVMEDEALEVFADWPLPRANP